MSIRDKPSVLLLNQTFHPDVMATGQYLSEIAVRLVGEGHQVTVITSARAYDNPKQRFPSRETWRGVEIYRVGSTSFGKTAKWRRAADFASFILSCCLRLLFMRRHAVVVALTTPPLISFIGAWLARFWRASFVYWVMDFNPDEAIAAGWLRENSLPARMLDWMSRFSLNQATSIIALDRFMRDRIIAKGIPDEKIKIIPPWSHDDHVRFDAAGRKAFRKAHGLEDKFVVMYSGNHSPVHPLDTLLEAAKRLAGDREILFCFVGGGSEWRKIQQSSDLCRLASVICLPYQPLDQLSASLSGADLHVVVMGDAMLGLVHPCKIYNLLNIGAPILYIGPTPSHVTEIFAAPDSLSSPVLRPPSSSLPAANGSSTLNHQASTFCSVRHGDVDGVVDFISRLKGERSEPGSQSFNAVAESFSKQALLPQITRLISDV